MSKTVVIYVRVPKGLDAALERVAEEEDRTKAGVIRLALASYLEVDLRKGRKT